MVDSQAIQHATSSPKPSSEALTALLPRLSTHPSPGDISLITGALVPSAPRETYALGYLALCKLVEVYSGQQDGLARDLQSALYVFEEESTDPAVYLPAVALLSALYPLAPVAATSLLSAPEPSHDPSVSSESAAATAGAEAAGSSPDPLGVLLESAELASPLQLALADLLASAAGTKPGRELVRSRAHEWLVGALDYGGDKALGALCAVALSKLGSSSDGPSASSSSSSATLGDANDEQLCDYMAHHITSRWPGPPTPDLLATLGGLAILSAKPRIKHRLAYNGAFLAALVALSPVPPVKGGSLPRPTSATPGVAVDELPANTGLCFGITTILLHLAARKPVLSAQDQQIARLRAMANAGASASASGAEASGSGGAQGKRKMRASDADADSDPLDEADAVRARVALLLRAGVVSALSGLVRAESTQVKRALGRLCLALVEEKADRLGFVRDGGFKVLGKVIRNLTSASPAATTRPDTSPTPAAPSTPAPTIGEALPALQALAKLAITTPPPLLFSPPHQTTAINALAPLCWLLVGADSLLQAFEALMALTNLASVAPELADRIITARVPAWATAVDGGGAAGSGGSWLSSAASKSEGATEGDKGQGVMDKVDELMLDDNTLVRRAAVELVCNLAGSERGYAYLSGDGEGEASAAESSASMRIRARATNRLRILLVLLQTDDAPTRHAAGGALAVLSESGVACEIMLGSSLRPGVAESEDEAESGEKGKTVWDRLAALFLPEEVDDPEYDDDDNDGNDHDDSDESDDLPPGRKAKKRGAPRKITLISSAPPDAAMMHRGAVVVLNLLMHVRGTGGRGHGEDRWVGERVRVEKCGLEGALMDVVRASVGGPGREGSVGREVLEVLVKALQLIKR